MRMTFFGVLLASFAAAKPSDEFPRGDLFSRPGSDPLWRLYGDAAGGSGPNRAILPSAEDGFYRPTNEEELIDLVKMAYDNGLQIRARGSSHSVSHAVYTDPGKEGSPIVNEAHGQKPPAKTDNINLLMDGLRGFRWLDVENGIVEVDAGLHLGGDPWSPDGPVPEAAGLLYQAMLEGWTMDDLGGIVHQSVSGFLLTGSSGGSVKHDAWNNVLAIKMIDGTGKAEWIEKGSVLFDAVGISFGLMGIVSRLKLQLTPLFSLYGQEVTVPVNESCPIDFFGDLDNGKPTMEEFMRNTDYSRIMWAPQPGVNRANMWYAARGSVIEGSVMLPYFEFSPDAVDRQTKQIFGAILYVLFGNLDDLSRVPVWLRENEATENPYYHGVVKELVDALSAIYSLSPVLSQSLLALLTDDKITHTRHPLSAALVKLQETLKQGLKEALAVLFDQQFEFSTEPKVFMDYAPRSLAMDHTADDSLYRTEFTEIWVPLENTTKVMHLLRDHFNQGGLGDFANAIEFYATGKSEFWMSCAYGRDVFRIDPFWFHGNAGDPAAEGSFYDGLWKLLRDNGVPFRLHWGKFRPNYDVDDWAKFFRSQFPKWDDFMDLRLKRDPRNVFLTKYWRDTLGLDENGHNKFAE